jgi:hypothetical protein
MSIQRPVHDLHTPWLTCWQAWYLSALIGVFLVIVVTAGVQRPAYLGLLCQHSAGLKMAVMAGLLLGVGTAEYLVSCSCLNRALARAEGGARTVYRVLIATIAVGYFLFFYLPAVFTVLVGPAAVQIQDSSWGG